MSVSFSTHQQKYRFRYWEIGLFVVLALLFTAVFVFVVFQPITVLPRIAPAPGFLLRDQFDASVSNEDLRGEITLYSFASLDCTACEQDVTALTAVYDTLQAVTFEQPVQYVTLLLDGVTDNLHSNDPRWLWLAGDPTMMKYVVGGGFDLYYGSNDNSEVAFAPRYVLVDQSGIIRARYFTAVPDSALLQRDINLLLQEAKNRTGSKKVAYEAAHLFLCYPR